MSPKMSSPWLVTLYRGHPSTPASWVRLKIWQPRVLTFKGAMRALNFWVPPQIETGPQAGGHRH